MIDEKKVTHLSKFLSLILRHKPETIGIILDSNGWIDVETLISKINASGTEINRNILNYVVETNTKKRFAFNDAGDKIRASQGHSIEIELGYTNQEPPEILYHGTAEKFVSSILQSGLEKKQRQHVHLSSDFETATKVGQRHGKPYIFKVLAAQMHKDNYAFYISDNGVWLTEHVPVKYLTPYTK